MIGAFLAAVSLAVSQQSPGVVKARVSIESELHYLIALPEGYEQGRQRWPLLLFLHGAGERGSDLEKLKVHGPPKEIANGRKLPFIVVSPQCPERDWWSSPLQVATLSALLDQLERTYRVDRDREYLTGLSMGGYGTWSLAAAQPRRFAAIAPICGVGDPNMAPLLKDMPIWAVHGDKDPAVPLEQDQKMVDAVRAAGGTVRFDVIKDGGHDVWTPVYGGMELYDWLLQQRRRR